MPRTKKLNLFSLIMVATLSFFVYSNLPAGRQEVVAATAPALKEGTYLTGQTLSVWPSWSLLGNALGVAFPTDPINQLAPAGTCATHTNIFCVKDDQCQIPVTTSSEKCVLHSPETGWSVVDRRFSFACSKDSYAYRYVVSSTPGVYMVRAHFEDDGITPANDGAFVSSFVSTTIFKINDDSGVCFENREISTMESGVCGDGKLNLNKGEQCDPPGRIEYAAGCNGLVRSSTVCNSGCHWTPSTTLCSNFSHCGNSIKELGEACDDGSFFNGKYNHCNIGCTGPVGNPPGRCGDGIVTSTFEVCDPGTPGLERYSSTSRNDSCSWDCQNWGPYCGDGLVQINHGETCDGSQTCSVDGNPGTKVCASNCLKKDRDAVAWWRFETLEASKTTDASANANDATCISTGCPVVGAGKYGHGLAFSSALDERFLAVVNNPSLFITSSVTVEAWIYPTDDSSLYQRIVEKKGNSPGSRSYDLEYNTSSTLHNVRFNLWNNGFQTAVVDSNSSIAINTWTHVVGTYARNGTSNVIKIYVNGVLENTTVVVSSTPIMTVGTGDLFIGKSSVADYFYGSMDEVKIYNRALSPAEVQNNYQSGWFCAATTTLVAPVLPAGSCGNNIVDAGETCDQGTANNGHVCIPAYGAPCSYCSADCQNSIDVQPGQYCGDGVIQSPEKCEVSGTNILSAASTTGRTDDLKTPGTNGYKELACADEPTPPHTIQKGVKSCADCSVGVVRNCVKCGVDESGVGVDGSVINVLQNPYTGSSETNPSLDSLFTKEIDNSSLSLVIGSHCVSKTVNHVTTCPYLIDDNSSLVAQAIKTTTSSDLVSYTLLNPYTGGNALLSSNPACSVDDVLENKYRMYVNSDWDRPLNFPVVASPQSWQYDLVLSPVVSSTFRSHDLRVVVSWVGSADFYSGVLNPFMDDPLVEGPSYVLPCTDFGCLFSYEYARGLNYYDFTTYLDAVFKKNGIWYHGFNSTPGQTNAESFTVDTGVTGGMMGNTYSFYVRAPSNPIRTFKNTAKLKVEVYLPEDDNSPYHFGTPAKTYYLQAAASSDNPDARYWQVFNISKPSPESPDLSASNIIEVNTIITDPAHFQYISLTPGVVPVSDFVFSSVPPSAPVLNVPVVGNGTVNLTWTAPADGGSPITNYKIWRSLPPGNTYSVAPSFTTPNGSTLAFNDTGLLNATTYHYKIKAVNAIGESAFSSQVDATPVAPTAPSEPINLVASGGGGGSIILKWSPPTNNGGSPITYYKIYRRTSPGVGVLDFWINAPDTKATYTDSAVVIGTTYYYRIKAHNSVGDSILSNESGSLPH